MELASFGALSFDCYGTLIDWESGIAAVLGPWARARGLDLDDEALLAAYSGMRPAPRPSIPVTGTRSSWPAVSATSAANWARRSPAPTRPGSPGRSRTGPRSATPAPRWPRWHSVTS